VVDDHTANAQSLDHLFISKWMILCTKKKGGHPGQQPTESTYPATSWAYEQNKPTLDRMSSSVDAV
jgi:hypothetical protein